MKRLLALLIVGFAFVPSVALAHGNPCNALSERPTRISGGLRITGSGACPQIHPETWIEITLQRRDELTSGSWSNVTFYQAFNDDSANVTITRDVAGYNCDFFYRTRSVVWQWNSAARMHNHGSDLSPNLAETC